MKKTLTERVTQILEELGINQVELANMAGCTKGAVNQWLKLSKPDSTMAPEHAYAIADKTNYEPRWLMIGEGNEKTEKPNEREKALLDLYRASDDRGRQTILRAAESESKYVVGEDLTNKKIA